MKKRSARPRREGVSKFVQKHGAEDAQYEQYRPEDVLRIAYAGVDHVKNDEHERPVDVKRDPGDPPDF